MKVSRCGPDRSGDRIEGSEEKNSDLDCDACAGGECETWVSKDGQAATLEPARADEEGDLECDGIRRSAGGGTETIVFGAHAVAAERIPSDVTLDVLAREGDTGTPSERAGATWPRIDSTDKKDSGNDRWNWAGEVCPECSDADATVPPVPPPQYCTPLLGAGACQSTLNHG